MANANEVSAGSSNGASKQVSSGASNVGLHGISQTDASLDPSLYGPEQILTRDVAVLGGGSSGTYAAVRLQDHGRSVIVIERSSRLGGHTQTYRDPETGFTLDVGVIVWGHLEQVKKYFARFHVPLCEMAASLGAPDYMDMAKGVAVDYKAPDAEAVAAAMAKYAELLQRFPKIQAGYYLEYPVAEDLMLPFGEFVEKYSLQALVPTAFAICQGYTPLLDISTLYVLKYLNADLLSTLSHSYLTTERNNAQELYDRAGAHIGGANVLLDAHVVAMRRDGSNKSKEGVRILLDTPHGRRLVLARKLLSSAPPLVENLDGWDLDANERQLFSCFFHNAFYSCVVGAQGFRGAPSVHSVDTSRPCSLPELPGVYMMNPHPHADLVQVYYGSPRTLDDATVKREVLAAVQRVQAARGVVASREPQMLDFASHVPFNMMVPNEAIRDGFYERLYALQGRRHTYHNGAAMHAQDSSVLWRFNDDEILPRLLKDLDEGRSDKR